MSIVETKMLTKVYGKGDTEVTALRNVNLNIQKGEFIAVMGPSGCGKSTLLNLLGCLDKPSSGSILIDGEEMSGLNDDRMTCLRRKKLGFVFQYFNLIPVLGAADNVALPMILDGKKAAEAKKLAVEWLGKLGLENRVNHKPDQLSGGQQQRVAIARALASEPALILADEPTGNLDSKMSDEVVGILRKASSEWNRTVLMVTHDSRIAAYADRIIFLKDGEMVDETRLSDVKLHNAEAIREKVDSL